MKTGQLETQDKARGVCSWVATLLSIRWIPNRDALVALASYVLVVVGLHTAFQVFTTAQVAANFIMYGIVSLAALGVAVPVFYTVLARRSPLADLGLSTRYLFPSIIIGLVLGFITYLNTIGPMNITWSADYVPLVAMALAVGLFEAIFFRGWLQLRFEASFGLIPGLMLAAGCYALYHVGYGMTADEMVTLFILGLIYGGVFRLTKNVATLWPVFIPMGSLFNRLSEGFTLPFAATYGFVIVLAIMAGAIVIAPRLRKRESPLNRVAAGSASVATR